MTDQTLQVLREMNKQALDEHGISTYLWMVSTILGDASGTSTKNIFYHRHASEFFNNRAETLKIDHEKNS